MKKGENKTKETEASVDDFIAKIEDEQKRNDCLLLAELMRDITGLEPKMWGPSIIGFGSYHYKYESGREGDSILTGFSPRKQNISIYTNVHLEEHQELLKNLGKYKSSVSCINIKKYSDIDTEILKELIIKGIARLKELYPSPS